MTTSPNVRGEPLAAPAGHRCEGMMVAMVAGNVRVQLPTSHLDSEKLRALFLRSLSKSSPPKTDVSSQVASFEPIFSIIADNIKDGSVQKRAIEALVSLKVKFCLQDFNAFKALSRDKEARKEYVACASSNDDSLSAILMLDLLERTTTHPKTPVKPEGNTTPSDTIPTRPPAFSVIVPILPRVPSVSVKTASTPDQIRKLTFTAEQQHMFEECVREVHVGTQSVPTISARKDDCNDKNKEIHAVGRQNGASHHGDEKSGDAVDEMDNGAVKANLGEAHAQGTVEDVVWISRKSTGANVERGSAAAAATGDAASAYKDIVRVTAEVEDPDSLEFPFLEAQRRKIKELSEMERQLEEQVESLASIEKSEIAAAEKQRQSRKRLLQALDDCSRAEAVSKKLKMDRIIAKATIEVQKEDVKQDRVTMHCYTFLGT